MKTSAIILFFLAIVLGWYIIADAGEIGDGFNDVSFRPTLGYKTVDTSHTGWNQVTLTGMVLFFGVGDTVTTAIGLNSGCSEANRLFGEKPSMWTIIPVKIAVMAGVWAVTEYLIVPEDRQMARNWIYGILSGAGLGATVWNTSQILR